MSQLERFLRLLLCSAKVQRRSISYTGFCFHRRRWWDVRLISTHCVAPPPLRHCFSLCVLKYGTQLSSFSVSLSLLHRQSLWMRVCNTITPVLSLIYPSFYTLSLSTSYGFRRSLWREQLLKYLLICFPQFYLFPSLVLPSLPHRPQEHLEHHEMSEGLKIHNKKPLFSVQCTQ